MANVRGRQKRVNASAQAAAAREKSVVVLVTCATTAEARRIAHAVVEARLAACVNILSGGIESIYAWKGKVESAREKLLVIKTSRGRLAKLQSAVERFHSYDVPEFVALTIVGGSPAYLAWLQESVSSAPRQGTKRG